MKINATILKDISSQVNHGNALWGIVVANEYLDKDDPIHSALVKKAQSRTQSESLTVSEDAELILSGKTHQQLPITTQSKIGAKKPLQPRHNLVVSAALLSSRSHSRIALRSCSPRTLKRRRPTSRPFVQHEVATDVRKLSLV